jgi:hypothetical protein
MVMGDVFLHIHPPGAPTGNKEYDDREGRTSTAEYHAKLQKHENVKAELLKSSKKEMVSVRFELTPSCEDSKIQLFTTEKLSSLSRTP